MPIDISQFESRPESGLRAAGATNAETILRFLAATPEQAYTPKEIHEATDVARGSVGVVLSRLEDRGLVRHRGDYWAIDPDAGAAQTLDGLRTARTMTERFGPEDPDEWGEEADTSTDESTDSDDSIEA